MALPVNKPRRRQEGYSKLEKELWLYKALYDDQKLRKGYRPVTDDDERDLLGVPVSELHHFLAPGVREESFLRTLNRYLRELEECGAVGNARVRCAEGERYCTADIPPNQREESPEGKEERLAPRPANPKRLHLARLARTIRLMDLWIQKWGSVGNLPETYNPHFYTKMFFDSMSDAWEWYNDVDNVPELEELYEGSRRATSYFDYRTIKRDMLAVWTVLEKAGDY